MDNTVKPNEEELSAAPEEQPKKPLPGFVDFLAGETKDVVVDLVPYLPQDLIGGGIPHIPGSEDEAVWNAASQACGTERVHYCYTVEGDRIWYLACPSSSMASNPDSWCPLAAALPEKSEYWDKETVYLYEQEGLASALRWDPETGRIQVFLGASRTVLPRVQSMDANFVTVNPEIADVVGWRSRTLRSEKLSRALIRTLVTSGLFVNLFAIALLLFSLISISVVKRDLSEVKKATDAAATELSENAANVMQSDTIKHMVRIQQILDKIALSNGYLVRYEVVGNRTEWEAVAPQGLAETAVDSLAIQYLTSSGGVRTEKPKVLGKEDAENARIRGKR